MQTNYTPFLRGLEIRQQAFSIQTNGLGIIVPVSLDLKVTGIEDAVVIWPGRIRDVNCFDGPETFDKVSADTECTGSGKGLDDGNVIGFDGGTIFSKDECRD